MKVIFEIPESKVFQFRSSVTDSDVGVARISKVAKNLRKINNARVPLNTNYFKYKLSKDNILVINAESESLFMLMIKTFDLINQVNKQNLNSLVLRDLTYLGSQIHDFWDMTRFLWCANVSNLHISISDLNTMIKSQFNPKFRNTLKQYTYSNFLQVNLTLAKLIGVNVIFIPKPLTKRELPFFRTYSRHFVVVTSRNSLFNISNNSLAQKFKLEEM